MATKKKLIIEINKLKKGNYSNSEYNPSEIIDVIYVSKEDMIYNKAVSDCIKVVEVK